MASIRKRRDKWQVQIRRSGKPAVSKSFLNKKDAEAWAREMERRADLGKEFYSEKILNAVSLADLLNRYRRDVTPTKKSADREIYRIGLILRHPIAKVTLSNMTSHQISRFRDWRLKSVASETVRQDLVLLRQVFELARREWDIPLLHNPVNDVRKPSPAKPRSRRLNEQELRKLQSAMTESKTPHFDAVIKFALATAMRRSEILGARWEAVNWEEATLCLSDSKNGEARSVPLSRLAIHLLEIQSIKTRESDYIFPLSAEALKSAWRRAIDRAEILDLRFHDLRHEAISRFFERGLSIAEVALISGHKDVRMLFRYTHLRASDVAKKLQ